MGFPQEENWVVTQLNETARAKCKTRQKKVLTHQKKPKLYRDLRLCLLFLQHDFVALFFFFFLKQWFMM